jgi:hypothetical protein
MSKYPPKEVWTAQKSLLKTLDLPNFLPTTLASAYSIAKLKLMNRLDTRTEEEFRAVASKDLQDFIDDIEKASDEVLDLLYPPGTTS